MQHPDEGVIHTWLDGELPAEEAVALEAHIAECADCAALVAEARGLIAASSRIVSALDIIPGDVIPATIPRKRPWYSSTQLRAAAAVVLVAGASLIVMREQEVPEMQTTMDRAVSADSSPSSAEAAAVEPPQFSIAGKSGTARRNQPLMTAPTETRAQSNQAASSPMKSATARQSEVKPKQKLDARDESAVAAEAKPSAVADAARSRNEPERALSGRIVGVQAPAPVVAPPTADLQQRNLSRLRDSSVRYDPVVVTGVATASGVVGAARSEAKLRELKSDTTGNIVVTIYELSPGIQVTLKETAPQEFAPQRAEADQLKKEKSGSLRANVAPVPAAPPAPVIGLRTTGAKTEVITWTNSVTGRVYTLSGPLSKEQLTALRKGLPGAKQ